MGGALAGIGVGAVRSFSGDYLLPFMTSGVDRETEWRARNRCPLWKWDHKFESVFLQRRVRCELDTAGSAIDVPFSGLPNVVDSPTTLNDSLTVIGIPCRTVIQHRVLFPKIRTRTARARG